MNIIFSKFSFTSEPLLCTNITLLNNNAYNNTLKYFHEQFWVIMQTIIEMLSLDSIQ